METCFVKTEQKIMHSGEYPSHILLPVIPLVCVHLGGRG